MFNKLKKFLKSKRAVGSVATAIKVGTACVLGAAVLIGGVALTNDVVLPNTSDKVQNVAEYEGDGTGGSTGGVTSVEVDPIDGAPNLLRMAKNRNLATSESSVFKECSLSVRDCLGINFAVDLSGLTESEKSGSFMTFVITKGLSSTVVGNMVSFTSAASLGNDLYNFTCKLNPTQVAETVTPTLHYGSETVVGPAYSIKQHIDYINENSSSYNPETVRLCNAIGNYGYHSQEYFKSRNGWTAGVDYTAMDNPSVSTYEDSWNTVKEAISTGGKTLQTTGGLSSGWSAGQYRYRLNTDDRISIEVVFAYNSSFEIINNDCPYECVYDDGAPKQFTVLLKYIPPQNLGTTVNIEATLDNNPVTLSISVYSYIYAILDKETSTDSAKNYVCAIYNYSLATEGYIDR